LKISKDPQRTPPPHAPVNRDMVFCTTVAQQYTLDRGMITGDKRRNLLMHNFNVAIADFSYMFRLHECNHHHVVYNI